MKTLMLILWTVVAVVAVNGWTAAVEGAKEAAYRKELEKLTGTWQLVASEKDGVKVPEAETKDIKITIKGDKFTMERAGKTVEEGWICIDPVRKPRVIDLYPTKTESEREFSLSPIVRSSELGHSRKHVVERLDKLTQALGLNRERARLWAFAHTLSWSLGGDRPFFRNIETAQWLWQA